MKEKIQQIKDEREAFFFLFMTVVFFLLAFIPGDMGIQGQAGDLLAKMASLSCLIASVVFFIKSRLVKD